MPKKPEMPEYIFGQPQRHVDRERKKSDTTGGKKDQTGRINKQKRKKGKGQSAR